MKEVKLDRDEDAEAMETELLDAVSGRRYRPRMYFTGVTECFTADGEICALISEYMELRCSELNQRSISGSDL